MDVDTGSVEALWVTKPTNTSTQKGQAEENRSKKKHALTHGIKKEPALLKRSSEKAYVLGDGDMQSIFILAESVWATEQRFPLTRKGKETAGLVRAARDPCRWQRRSSELKTTVTQSNNPNTPHQFLISSIRINYEAEGNLCTLCLRLPTGLIKNWMLEN